MARNLLAIKGPSNNCQYEMCGVVHSYRRPSSPVGSSEANDGCRTQDQNALVLQNRFERQSRVWFGKEVKRC
jgi:hypothetical protein